MITRHDVAKMLTDYLHHRMTLAELVNWAELAMMNGNFDEEDYELVRSIVSRLGLADANHFSLTWEDFERFLQQLGYQVQIEVLPVI